MLGLDTKNGILGIHTVSIGALDRTLVSPREVFKAAILLNAGGIIVGHNHPSGDPDPSIEDRQVANRLHDAGQLLDIELLDSIIIGDRGRWVSLKQLGVF
jgi:DNA repair protein RadC